MKFQFCHFLVKFDDNLSEFHEVLQRVAERFAKQIICGNSEMFLIFSGFAELFFIVSIHVFNSLLSTLSLRPKYEHPAEAVLDELRLGALRGREALPRGRAGRLPRADRRLREDEGGGPHFSAGLVGEIDPDGWVISK